MHHPAFFFFFPSIIHHSLSLSPPPLSLSFSRFSLPLFLWFLQSSLSGKRLHRFDTGAYQRLSLIKKGHSYENGSLIVIAVPQQPLPASFNQKPRLIDIKPAGCSADSGHVPHTHGYEPSVHTLCCAPIHTLSQSNATRMHSRTLYKHTHAWTPIYTNTHTHTLTYTHAHFSCRNTVSL